MNGKPGDHPITDIVSYRQAVFTPIIDLLIAEIVALGGRPELENRYGDFRPVPTMLESELHEIRDRREAEARAAGWPRPPLD